GRAGPAATTPERTPAPPARTPAPHAGRSPARRRSNPAARPPHVAGRGPRRATAAPAAAALRAGHRPHDRAGRWCSRRAPPLELVGAPRGGFGRKDRAHG